MTHHKKINFQIDYEFEFPSKFVTHSLVLLGSQQWCCYCCYCRCFCFCRYLVVVVLLLFVSSFAICDMAKLRVYFVFLSFFCQLCFNCGCCKLPFFFVLLQCVIYKLTKKFLSVALFNNLLCSEHKKKICTLEVCVLLLLVGFFSFSALLNVNYDNDWLVRQLRGDIFAYVFYLNTF